MRFVAVALSMLSSAALAADPEDSDSRFYAGLGAAGLSYEGEHRGVVFDDSSLGVDVYAGYRVTDTLGLELAYKGFDTIEVRDIAGSGTDRLDIDSELDAVVVKAVADFSLQDLLSWQRDWRLYGAVGYYQTDAERTVTTLGAPNSEAVHEEESGLLLGAGVIYKLGIVDLRGYVEWFGVFDEREAWDAGVAVQFSF